MNRVVLAIATLVVLALPAALSHGHIPTRGLQGFQSNEPAQFETLLQSSFNSLAALELDGWTVLPPKTWTRDDGSTFTTPAIVDDSDFMYPPVVQQTYPEGLGDEFGTGTSGGTRLTRVFEPVEEMYVSWWYKLDPGWRNSGGNMKMIGILQVSVEPFAWIRASGDGPALQFDMNQRTYQTGQQAESTIRRPNVGNKPVQAGQVHFYEVYLKMNTPGVPDGIIKMWLDGVLLHDHRDVVWVADAAFPFKAFAGIKWDPTIGGRSPAPEQWGRFDELYVSGR